MNYSWPCNTKDYKKPTVRQIVVNVCGIIGYLPNAKTSSRRIFWEDYEVHNVNTGEKAAPRNYQRIWLEDFFFKDLVG